MKIRELLYMGTGEAIDWLIENQNNFALIETTEAPKSRAPSGQAEFDLLSVGDRFEKAEHEILKVCKKYNIGLAPKYDDGVAVVMCASEPHEGGGNVNHEREIDT